MGKRNAGGLCLHPKAGRATMTGMAGRCRARAFFLGAICRSHPGATKLPTWWRRRNSITAGAGPTACRWCRRLTKRSKPAWSGRGSCRIIWWASNPCAPVRSRLRSLRSTPSWLAACLCISRWSLRLSRRCCRSLSCCTVLPPARGAARCWSSSTGRLRPRSAWTRPSTRSPPATAPLRLSAARSGSASST